MIEVAFYPYEEISWTIKVLEERGIIASKETLDMEVVVIQLPCLAEEDIDETIGSLSDGSWWYHQKAYFGDA